MLSLIVAVAAALLVFTIGSFQLPGNLIIAVGFALLLGFVTWTSFEKFLTKHQKRIDDSDIFPLLRKDALERWGAECGEQYKHLNKIVLYDAPLKYPIDSRYILYFDFDTSTSEGEKNEETFNTIKAFQINAILNSEFKKVYRKEPGSRFRDEWFLSIVKYSNFNDKYAWVIYQRDKLDRST